MYKLEVKPDVATYDILLKACDKQGKVTLRLSIQLNLIPSDAHAP